VDFSTNGPLFNGKMASGECFEVASHELRDGDACHLQRCFASFPDIVLPGIDLPGTIKSAEFALMCAASCRRQTPHEYRSLDDTACHQATGHMSGMSSQGRDLGD
jgi:hypothetical protein